MDNSFFADRNKCLENDAELLVERAPSDYDCIVGNVAAFIAALGADPDALLGGVLVASPGRRGNFDDIGDHQIRAGSAAAGFTVCGQSYDDKAIKPDVAVVVGDGWDMPWSPYYGVHHVEHGFLVLNDSIGFDAYNTITEFGDAVPQLLKIDSWRSVPVRRRLYLDVTTADMSEPAKPTVVHDKSAVRGYRAAVESGMASIEQLAVDTWSLARARRVNLRFAAHANGELKAKLQHSVEAWGAASEAVYFALRRFRRGRSVPTTYIRAITTALDVDQEIIGRW